MEMDENNKFEVENESTKVKYSSEVGNPPLVVVVQGGKNVNFNKYLINSQENQH
jgi:hypothetical protein